MRRVFLFTMFFCVFNNLFGQVKEITVEDLWTNWTFYPNSVYGINSMNDGENYTTYARDKIKKYSYETGNEVEEILNTTKLGIGTVSSDYQFNNDETKLLIYANEESIYRRSFFADYYVYDIKTTKLTAVSNNGKQQLATFSPLGDKIAFVRSNNLFIKDLNTGEEKQITTDGLYNNIINGAPDWVYEEEFAFNKAFEWSPDGKNLAFIKFEESGVKMFNMTIYSGLEPKNETNVLYPENETFKYPKAGEDNSKVTVHFYNLSNQKTTTVDIGTETDIYIPRIRWTQDNDKLCVMRLNRLQNKLELLYANPKDGSTKIFFSEENKYYIEETGLDKIQFLEDGKTFIMMSERSGYRHLYLYNVDGTLIRQLTSGNWDVIDYLGYNPKKKLIYYQSAEESPLRRTIYSIDLEAKTKTKLSTRQGTNDAVFSTTFKYFINYFTNLSTPNYVTLNDANGKEIRVLEDNADLIKLVEEYGGIKKEFIVIKTSEGVELNASILYPQNFDKTKKYPVLITQYSGPNSQSVLDSWSFDWENLLAQKGYIIATVDPRGTGARGEEFRKITYLQLGKYETIDLIESAKYLGTLTYVDASRIGIWGWSYGGYMSLSCMTKGADVYKTGIAVAPVTNWRYYDNIYTERYMRKPQENAAGYDDNSPINFADKLKGNLLIVHGTADDNVHLQNSMEFIEALVQADKQFDMHIYTNRNHSIFGGNTRTHLYKLMTNYLLKNL